MKGHEMTIPTPTRRETIIGMIAATATAAIPSTAEAATVYEVQMKNSGEAGPMVFEPALTRVATGDTVKFVPVDKGHNAESIKDILPEGAEPFKGKISQEIDVTFTVPGVYGIKCLPHFGMGMVALIVVDDPATNLEDAKTARLPRKARERIDAAITEIGASA
jgi:pseudoazurin